MTTTTIHFLAGFAAATFCWALVVWRLVSRREREAGDPFEEYCKRELGI